MVEFLTEEENVFHQNVHILIPVTISVMEVITKRRNVMNSAVQVSFHKSTYTCAAVYCIYSKQKNHTGVHGRTGLSVVRSAEVEYLTERGSVSHQNVHILTIKNVTEMITKRRSVMNIAAQVWHTPHSFVHS